MVRGLILGTIALCYLTLNWAFDSLGNCADKGTLIGFVFAAGTVLVGLPSLADAGSTIAFVTAAGLLAILLTELHQHCNVGRKSRFRARQALDRHVLASG